MCNIVGMEDCVSYDHPKDFLESATFYSRQIMKHEVNLSGVKRRGKILFLAHLSMKCSW